MIEFIITLGWFLLSLGILITFHEFGHFWVARRLGVRVLRFSVGFGRPLWRRYGRDGTEYVLAAIPLGGYVKMLDEREQAVAPADRAQAFNRQSVWARIAIVAAGPIANLILAVAAFWLMFVIGKPDFKPVIAEPTGIAQAAGLKDGDELVEIAGQPIKVWSQATIELVRLAIARNDVPVVVRQADGDLLRVILPVSRIARGVDERQALRELGVQPKLPSAPAVVGRLSGGRPAALAGLEVGDEIAAINGAPVADFAALVELIQREAGKAAPLELQVRRAGSNRTITLTAEPETGTDGKPRFVIGIGPIDTRDALLRYSPLAAVPAALRETWHLSTTTLEVLGRMLVGHASLQNIAGPVGIAQIADSSASMGLAWFLSFLALMSLSIAILNLLPIPILDGGHLMYYFIELLKGSPVSERVMLAGNYVGLVLLAGLMCLAFFNDFTRLFG